MTHFTLNDTDSVANTVFAGLVPAAVDNDVRARRQAQQRARVNRNLMNTVPVILVGTLAAATFNLTGPVEPVNAKTPNDPRLSTERVNKPTAVAPSALVEAAATVVGPAPASYTVAEGDTVSDIASRFGLSTASVLALNGLSWSSMIFPGQDLKLTKATSEPLPSVSHTKTTNGEYTIVAGDTISGIAAKFGISTISVMSANGLGWSSIIYPGQLIVVPGNLSAPSEDTQAYDFTTEENSAPDAPSDSVDDSAATEDDQVEDTTSAPDDADAAPEEVTPAPEPAPEPAPAPVAGSTYLVVSGDTISAIAKRSGISTQHYSMRTASANRASSISGTN
ncbi:lipoprotein [marine actinobacterium PHSC20C1]|nr:lipoprotein [marine actinobacterium PHSC20C1]